MKKATQNGNSDKWGIIQWLIESAFRLSKKSPTFFTYLAWFGVALVLLAGLAHGLMYYHLKTPEILAWLNDGFFVGLGSGLTVTSVLTLDKANIPQDQVEKKMPVTAKNDLNK